MEDRINESNIADAEKETIHVASATLSALESALAAWEEAKVKPEELRLKFERYAAFRDALAGWLRMMLKAQGGGLRARQERLLEFSAICRRYKGGA